MNNKFKKLCEALPADVNWGDPLTPEIAEAIWQAAIEEKNKIIREALSAMMQELIAFEV